MAAKKKVTAAAPKSCVKKFTLTLQPGCQDIKKFFPPKVSSKKTYAAAAQATLPQKASKPAPVIDLVSPSSSEIYIIDDTAKGPATTSDATTSDADAPVASTSHDLISSSKSETCTIFVAAKSQDLAKATYASIAAKPCDASSPFTSRGICDASAPLDSSTLALKPDEDPSNELQKNGIASSSSSSTTPSPPPSKRRLDAEDAPLQKRRRRNSSSSSLATTTTRSSPPSSSIESISSTSPPSAPNRRRVNFATAPSSTLSTIGTATSSTPTPSSSTSPPSSNNLTIDTTLYEKLAEGFKMVEIFGDGACFFRACSHQEYGTEERHQEFRKAANQYFVDNRDELEHQILALHGGTFKQFLDEQIQQKTFADYFDVSAVANVYGVQIIIYRPDSRATVFDPVNGVTDASKKPYLLAFVDNIHYNSIIPIDQECNSTVAAISLKRSDDSIAMDYITPRRTVPARRSKFAKAPVIDNVSDDDSVFEPNPIQSDDGLMQSDGDFDVEEDGSTETEETTEESEIDDDRSSEPGMHETETSSSSSISCADKNVKLTREEKLFQNLNEEFLNFYQRRDYYKKNNEQPQIHSQLQYSVLAMTFFYSMREKGRWWTGHEIIKWIKANLLYYKKQTSNSWTKGLTKRMSNNKTFFSKRGSRAAPQYSFNGTFPDVDKATSPRMSQLIVSPKKSKKKDPPADKKYAKEFVHFHQYRDFYSKNDVSPTARTGAILMYFFYSQQKHGTSWTTRDIAKWVKENIMFYRNKPNENWLPAFISFFKRNKKFYPKTGALLHATYSFKGDFPQLEKGGADQSPPFAQPVQSTNQKDGAANYIHGIKLMKCSPKLAAEKDEDFIYFHQHRDYFSKNNVKPELQYGVFVRYFFSLNEFGTWFTLKEICSWIEENILYYKTANKGWKDYLRNYLRSNKKIFPCRGSGYNIQYSYVKTFPAVDPDDIYEHPPFARKQLFKKFADEPIIKNWTFTDETKKEIKIPSCSHIYHIQKGSSRTPDNIEYLYCVNCASKNGKRAHISGEFISKLNCTVSKLQLNDGVLRGNFQAAHLCEDEDYAEYSGREQFGIFTVEDPERFIKDVKELSKYMAQLQGETMKLKIFQFIPDPWLQPHCFRCVYLYGLGYSSDPRNLLYIGVTWNPQKRLPGHMYIERPELFKNKDGTKREVHMILLLCMPSLHQLAYELEAALISYGQNHHNVLKLKKPLTNVDKGRWQDGGLQKISRSTRHADFGKVGRALRDLLDDGVARGPRISSFAVGITEDMKEHRKEKRRLTSS